MLNRLDYFHLLKLLRHVLYHFEYFYISYAALISLTYSILDMDLPRDGLDLSGHRDRLALILSRMAESDSRYLQNVVKHCNRRT